MHRRIEHIAAELLICRSPASISNYIFSAVFTYFWGGFLRKKRWLLGRSPRPRWGSLQRSPTPPSWAGGVPPSRTLPGAAPPTTSPHPLPHPRRCPPPPPNSWIRHWVSRRELLVIVDRPLWTKPTSSLWLSVICGACSICVYGSYNYFYLLSISNTSSALYASRELGH